MSMSKTASHLGEELSDTVKQVADWVGPQVRSWTRSELGQPMRLRAPLPPFGPPAAKDRKQSTIWRGAQPPNWIQQRHTSEIMIWETCLATSVRLCAGIRQALLLGPRQWGSYWDPRSGESRGDEQQIHCSPRVKHVPSLSLELRLPGEKLRATVAPGGKGHHARRRFRVLACDVVHGVRVGLRCCLSSPRTRSGQVFATSAGGDAHPRNRASSGEAFLPRRIERLRRSRSIVGGVITAPADHGGCRGHIARGGFGGGSNR